MTLDPALSSRAARSFLASLVSIGATGCCCFGIGGELGRSSQESAALAIGADPSVTNEDAPARIAAACAGPLLREANVSGGVLTASVEVDSEVQSEVIDRHGHSDSMQMNVEGYRRQVARAAMCMLLAGEGRGIDAVDLAQWLPLPFENRRMLVHRLALSRTQLETVPSWREATISTELDWQRYDAAFTAGDLLEDHSGELQIVTYH